MPTQLIEFEAPSGMTLTAKLFVGGSDTVSYTASSVVEQTNRKGIYQATFANVAANNYQLIATSGANAVAAWWGYAADTASTFQFGSISGAIGRESIDANALAASAATEIAAAVNAGLSGSAVQLISPVTDTGTLVVFNGRTYGGAAHSSIAFTVAKNYTSATYVELVLFTLGDPATELQTLPSVVASSTSITTSGTINISGEYTGEIAVLVCGYTLQASWSGSMETIATGKAYVYKQPT